VKAEAGEAGLGCKRSQEGLVRQPKSLEWLHVLDPVRVRRPHS